MWCLDRYAKVEKERLTNTEKKKERFSIDMSNYI